MDKNDAANRLRLHDETALEEIVKAYTPYVSTIIYNVTKGGMSISDMEEVTADVFITLWKNSEKVNGETLTGYLAAIAKSKTKDKLRRVTAKADIVDIENAELADSYSLADTLDTTMLSRDIESSINELGKPDREIVIRYYYYYQSTPKIADILGLNADTVKTKLRRARLKLKKFLTERGY